MHPTRSDRNSMYAQTIAPAILLALCTVGFAQSGNVDEPAPAAELIQQLGADSFHEREAAMAKLIAIGPSVEEEVEAATDAADPEVAYRARKILKEIDRSLITQQREAFLGGDVEKLKANAESWQRMEEMLGNTRESGELFL